jgi:hypothetical protein
MLRELLFFEKGAMSFLDKEIPSETIEDVLSACTPYAWLGKWKLLYVTSRETRLELVNIWQESLRSIGQSKDADFIERWKIAPLFIVFCQPKRFEQFHFVPPDFVRIFSIQEIGGAVRSVELSGLIHGLGLHGIMGILVPAIGEPIKEVLKIPLDYEIVYFGIMGYPDEEVAQKFPDLEEVCYSDTWGRVP